MPDFEITVVGAGVVGLAIAARLSEKHSHLVVLEKNEKYGLETSSRNSEVIHAGIYYKPGSLKARLCVEGRDELYALCRQHGISYQQISKIITATNDQELKRLESIYQNGLANGVGLEMLDKNATLRMEPHIETVGAIYSPLTGIINAHELMDYFYHKSTNDGATVQLRCEVVKIERTSGGYEITVRESGIESSFTCEVVINGRRTLMFGTVTGRGSGVRVNATGTSASESRMDTSPSGTKPRISPASTRNWPTPIATSVTAT